MEHKDIFQEKELKDCAERIWKALPKYPKEMILEQLGDYLDAHNLFKEVVEKIESKEPDAREILMAQCCVASEHLMVVKEAINYIMSIGWGEMAPCESLIMHNIFQLEPLLKKKAQIIKDIHTIPLEEAFKGFASFIKDNNLEPEAKKLYGHTKGEEPLYTYFFVAALWIIGMTETLKFLFSQNWDLLRGFLPKYLKDFD